MLEPEYLFTVVEHFELEYCVHNYTLYYVYKVKGAQIVSNNHIRNANFKEKSA